MLTLHHIGVFAELTAEFQFGRFTNDPVQVALHFGGGVLGIGAHWGRGLPWAVLLLALAKRVLDFA